MNSLSQNTFIALCMLWGGSYKSFQQTVFGIVAPASYSFPDIMYYLASELPLWLGLFYFAYMYKHSREQKEDISGQNNKKPH
jgi:hypothetical protein